MKRLADKGCIPKKFSAIDPPPSMGQIFGSQTRTRWREKCKHVKHIRKPEQDYPGGNTSTGQMVSKFPGLILQVRGRPMRMKYAGATFFVDHCTDKLYIHLMTNFSGEATLEAKHAYECLCGSEGV